MGRGIWGLCLLTSFTASAAPSVSFAQLARPPAAAPVGRPAARLPATQAGRPAEAAKALKVARPTDKPDDPEMKALLKEWEKRSAQLTSLDVELKRTDKDPAWGVEIYRGRAMLQSPNKACLNFQKEIKGPKGKIELVDDERIVCTGSEVWQYKPATKQIFIFPLDPESRKRALEEGPLPFLFNMKAAEAEARYQMNLIREEKDYYVIRVFPRLAIDQESFREAYLKLNRQTYLPDRIYLISPNEKSIKDFELSNVRANVKLPPANFVGNPLGKPWQIVRDPQDDSAPPRQRRGNPSQQPASPSSRLGNQPQPPSAATPRRR